MKKDFLPAPSPRYKVPLHRRLGRTRWQLVGDVLLLIATGLVLGYLLGTGI